MCRNIRPLFNFEPPVTQDEIRAAVVQFVRKVSGFNKPSLANQAAFDKAVAEIAKATSALIDSLVTASAPKNRETILDKARARSVFSK